METTARDHLLAAHSILSPSIADNEHINSLVAEMEKENQPEPAILKAILCEITDGLLYGNWHSILEAERIKLGYIHTVPYA